MMQVGKTSECVFFILRFSYIFSACHFNDLESKKEYERRQLY